MSAREDVTFESAGVRCAAWLYRPDGATGPVPVVVMGHGIGGVREMRLDAYAERFAAAGYACLVFDYRHFGGSDGEPRQLIHIKRQREDWHSAIAFARTLDGVDPDRVVIWGSSFGGGHVIAVGADDPRVAAVVSQCPFTDGLASALAVPFLTSVRLTVKALRDRVGSWFGAEPVLVPLAARPGGVALMTSPDAYDGYVAIAPPEGGFRNEAAARFAIDIAFAFPGRRAKDLACPALFVVCNRDTVAPARATERHVAKARRGEVARHEVGHFDIYVGDAFEHVVADELDFLRRHVPVQAVGAA
ncbi:MAG: alpha/beta fold hydrolase [Aeromicrobium erythreum]